jgi:hypothetical protein
MDLLTSLKNWNSLTTGRNSDPHFFERPVWRSHMFVGHTVAVLFDEVSAVALLIRHGARLPAVMDATVVAIGVALLLTWARLWIQHDRVRSLGAVEPGTTADAILRAMADSALRGLLVSIVVAALIFLAIAQSAPLR